MATNMHSNVPPLTLFTVPITTVVETLKTQVVVIIAKGSLTANDQSKLLDVVGELRRSSIDRVLLDIGGLDVMDGAGAGTLIITHNLLRERKKKFAVTRASGIPWHIIQALRIGALIHIFPEYPDHLHW